MDDDESKPLVLNVDLFKTIPNDEMFMFHILWALVLIICLSMRIMQHPLLSMVSFVAIVFLPIMNFCLTFFYDKISFHYRAPKVVESVAKRRFLFPFIMKVIAGIVVVAEMFFHTNTGLWVRVKRSPEGLPPLCQCHLWVIFLCFVLGMAGAELICTTVVVNGSQNLSEDTPQRIHWLLLILRPFVWLYNRALIFCVSFYGFYVIFHSLFIIGALCSYYCRVNPAQQHALGFKMVTEAFENPFFWVLPWGQFNAFDPNHDTEQMLAAAMLLWLNVSFYVDVVNSIWGRVRIFLLDRGFTCIRCGRDQELDDDKYS